jgi:hypothetical protein
VFGSLVDDGAAELDKTSKVYFTFPSSRWLTLAERADVAVAFTIPVPLGGGALAEGAGFLIEARHQLNDGNLDAAILAARQAMERVESAAQWAPIRRNDDFEQRDQGQRWLAVLKAAMGQAAGAVHADEVTR